MEKPVTKTDRVKPSINPNDAALKFLAAMREQSNRVEIQIGLQTICVLGNHENRLSEIKQIADTLNADNYPTVYLKGLDTTDLSLPDFECERIAISKADLLLIIDDYRGGTVSECTYIMGNHAFLSKSILMVEEEVSEEDFFSTEKHYCFFPRKVRFNNPKLVDITVKAAKQAMHGLAQKALTQKGDDDDI